MTVRDRRYYQAQNAQAIRKENARKAAALQAELNHRANPRKQDNDELLAACGLPPRSRPLEAA